MAPSDTQTKDVAALWLRITTLAQKVLGSQIQKLTSGDFLACIMQEVGLDDHKKSLLGLKSVRS